MLPVAPAAEKAGRYVTWEGRRRPFDLTIAGTGAMSDGRVLHALAEELDVELGLPTVGGGPRRAARARRRGTAAGRPDRAGTEPRRPRTAGEALLATWHELLDAGRMQDGDEHLAGTAKPARALISAATASSAGIGAGGTSVSPPTRGARRCRSRSATCPTAWSGCRPTPAAVVSARRWARGTGRSSP